MLRSGRRLCLGVLVLAAILAGAQSAWAAKNVIILVADGAGWNTWIAAAMYQGKLGKQIYDGDGWIQYGQATYPRTLSSLPTQAEAQDPALVYDPAKYWDATAATGKSGPSFAGYKYASGAATDSAAAATAMATGWKTYNNAINVTDQGCLLRGQTIAEIARRQGKSCGAVTTVPWSHATPAALGGAHNPTRNAYAEIAREMLSADTLDVIFGAGHPDFDENGRRLNPMPSKPNYGYVGGAAAWKELGEGIHTGGWKLVQTKAEFEALATGPAPRRVVGLAPAATTLQANRSYPSGAKAGKKPAPYECRFNENVPSLATMTRAALNCLDKNPKGLYLMIEGGAVDWANHANDAGRMIEEFGDYLVAVAVVCAWVEKNGGWDETLVILTADHDTGLPWGPDSDTVPFQPLTDNGPGKLPGLKYHTGGHSNSLVPLYVRGAGGKRFAEHVCATDPQAAKAWSFSGKYVENTAIFRVMEAAVLDECQR